MFGDWPLFWKSDFGEAFRRFKTNGMFLNPNS